VIGSDRTGDKISSLLRLRCLKISFTVYNNNNNNNNNSKCGNGSGQKWHKKGNKTLCTEIKRKWNMICMLIPVINGATGMYVGTGNNWSHRNVC
jgi:hypothetical protein